MQAIWKFHWDCCRMGEVYGLFVADEKDIANAIGKFINLGEALGKHSEIYGDIGKDDIKLMTNDELAVKMFIDNELQIGYNPLEYMEDIEE